MLLAKGRNNDKELVHKLQEGLAAFGYHPGAADGILGQKTEDAIEEWQRKNNLYPDGLFGKGSAAIWNALCTQKGRPEFIFILVAPAAPLVEPTTRLKWVSVPATPLAGGFDNTTLRADAAEAYKALLAEVTALGGVISSAGGKRSLSSKAGAARSKVSYHYIGRAFDQATGYCMQNPDKDRFIAVRDSEGTARTFTVWCKTDNPAVPVVTLKACWCRTLKNTKGVKYTQLYYKDVTVRAFNFTEVALKHGWHRISGRKFFFSGGSYDGAEVWHYQWTEGLVKNKTTFGEELLRVYSLAECQKFLYWDEAQEAVYGDEW